MKNTTFFRTSALSLLMTFAMSQVYAQPSAYVRFPSIGKNEIVFTSEGDLWKVGLQGGAAQRLTTHAGQELYPAISQDNQWIAFSASYEGGQEAYVMPLQGGVPQRISFENTAVTVLGWDATGRVLVSMQHDKGPLFHTVIALINPKTLDKTVLPFSDVSEAAMDKAGKHLFFTRMGLQTRADNAKTYRGGAMSQIWVANLAAAGEKQTEATQLFSSIRANFRRPMLSNGKLYYLSDESGAYNLYEAQLDGSQAQALTQYRDWEVRFPQLSGNHLVFQLGADLMLLDLSNRQTRKLEVNLVSDFEQSRIKPVQNALNFLTDINVAPQSNKIVLTAKGQMTVAATGVQRRVDIHMPDSHLDLLARARHALFSPDEKWIYAFVDASGENEIWRFPANGMKQAQQLTKDAKGHRIAMKISPNGKWLAHSDRSGRLFLLDLHTWQNTQIDSAGEQGFGNYQDIVWSYDSQTLAVSRDNTEAGRDQIGLYDIASSRWHFITGDRYQAYSPAFSPDGKWLYFLSDRNYAPMTGSPWSDRNMGTSFDKRVNMYAVSLQKENRFPFKPDDELMSGKEARESKEIKDTQESKESNATKDVKDNKSTSVEIRKSSSSIDYDKITHRIYALPVPSGNYTKLDVDDKRLYVVDREGNDFSRQSLKTLAISKNNPQLETYASNLRSYELSSNKKRLMLALRASTGTEFYVVEPSAKIPADLSQAKIKVEDWFYTAEPKQEWQQMFLDAWRMHRDYLYDKNMRGVNWVNVKDKYLPLVKRVADKAELNDVLSMMSSELGSLHSQIRPGEVRQAANTIAAGMLGATLSKTSDGYKIEHIYKEEMDLVAQRSPLNQPDVDVKEGDVIIAVNGQSVNQVRHIHDLLLGKVDKQVILHIKRVTPQGSKEHKVLVYPISTQRNAELRYSDWEQSLEEKVLQSSNGKIGYLHIRSMISNDLSKFARDYYAHTEREGLIIDVRRNNGGNIDSMLIEKLLRKAWMFWKTDNKMPYVNMQQTFRGHIVVLSDELTYSDGETFTYGIKALNIGKVIGKRTAGAGVWLSDGNALVDGGMARAAEHNQHDIRDGTWMIEGKGVEPDIEVHNLPHATFKGDDAQLQAAIAFLKKEIESKPIKALVPQAIPPLQRK